MNRKTSVSLIRKQTKVVAASKTKLEAPFVSFEGHRYASYDWEEPEHQADYDTMLQK